MSQTHYDSLTAAETTLNTGSNVQPDSLNEPAKELTVLDLSIMLSRVTLCRWRPLDGLILCPEGRNKRLITSELEQVRGPTYDHSKRRRKYVSQLSPFISAVFTWIITTTNPSTLSRSCLWTQHCPQVHSLYFQVLLTKGCHQVIYSYECFSYILFCSG